MPVIEVDEDQADWGSSRIYPDGGIPGGGLWVPNKGIGHWGGRTIPPLLHMNCRRILRGWQRYHINTKGWRDIAYNYPFCNHGVTFRARGWNPSGATSGDFEGDGIRENAQAVAIVHIGGSGGSISAKGFEAAGRLWRQVMAKVLDPALAIGHRDVKPTSCPGNQYYDWVHSAGWETTPPPPPPSEDYTMQTVREGDGYRSKGTFQKRVTVQAAQIQLAYNGYADARTVDKACSADGVFGPGTKASTINFQRARGLKPDGVIGPKTWEKLDAW